MPQIEFSQHRHVKNVACRHTDVTLLQAQRDTIGKLGLSSEHETHLTDVAPE